MTLEDAPIFQVPEDITAVNDTKVPLFSTLNLTGSVDAFKSGVE